MTRRLFALIVLSLACVCLRPARAQAAGSISTPTICVGAPASCTYTIISTSDLIIACGVNGGGTENVNTPTASNVTFTAITADQNNVASGLTLHCFSGIATATGSTAFSFASQFGDTTYGVVAELSGVLTTSMNDTNAFAGANTGASMDSGSFTTTATDVLIGFGFDAAASTPTAGTGWTKTSPPACTCNADTRLILEYQLDKSATAYHATATKSASSGWAIQGFGIKEPGGGGTAVLRQTLLGVGP